MARLNRGLCERFKQVRINAELTQKQLADLIDVLQSEISGIETFRFEPSKNHILKIIKQFDIDGHWLLTGEGEMRREIAANSVKEDAPTYGTKENSALIEENTKLKQEIKNLRAWIHKIMSHPPPPD